MPVKFYPDLLRFAGVIHKKPIFSNYISCCHAHACQRIITKSVVGMNWQQMYAVAIGSIQLSWLNILFMLRHKPVYLFSEITAIYSTHPQLPLRLEHSLVKNWLTLGASSGEKVNSTKKLTCKGTSTALPLADGRLSEVRKHNPWPASLSHADPQSTQKWHFWQNHPLMEIFKILLRFNRAHW